MESGYCNVHERSKGNRVELYGINLQYFSTSNLYIVIVSISLHAIVWWEINIVRIIDSMGIILGSMHTELSEPTARLVFHLKLSLTQ